MIRMTTLCPKLATVITLGMLLTGAAFAQEQVSILHDYSQVESQAIPLVGAGQAIPLVASEQSVDVEELDVLTRGPLHEAFASAHQADPQSSTPIFKAPPELIDELPPEYKPEGNNVQWISGYWAWDDAQSDFIWISGIWRDVPPNRRWMPGYWDAEGNAHRWVSGVWIEETQQELGYLPQPPASIDQGPSTIAPSEKHFYVPGNWQFDDNRYRWLSGHWQPVVENRIWVPARYVWTPNGCVYQSGYWDYELEDRGTCFAPVHFTQPVYLANNYSYRPSYAINLNTDFMTHLFVREHCGHYFYGDWYASNFNSLGYRPWVSYTSHFRNYDPLLTYYRSRRSSFDNRYNVVQYLARQHSFYINNRDYRPRPTYQAQFKHALNLQQRNGGRSYSNDYIRKSSYVGAYKDLRNNGPDHRGKSSNVRYQPSKSKYDFKKHHKVAREELRYNSRKQEQLAGIQRDRQRIEHSGRNRVSTSSNVKSRVSSSSRQRELERLRNAQDISRQTATHAQRRSLQLEQSRRTQLEQAKRHQQDRDRRTQQEKVRRSQQELARKSQQASAQRAKQDQARRAQQDRARQQAAQRSRQQQAQRDSARKAQQDQARRAQQDRARQQAAQRSRQQQAQRDSARRAKQTAQKNSARVATKSKKASKQNAPQQSRASRLTNRSNRK